LAGLIKTDRKKMNTNRNSLMLSLPLAALIIFTSVCGLLVKGFYTNETLNWQLQSMMQDFINLVIVAPLLILTAILVFRGNKIALQLWSGVNLYIVYTFVIYCFDLHFNYLFVAYCFILGLSFYSLLYFLFSYTRLQQTGTFFEKRIVKTIAVYFLVISLIFYCIWLWENIVSILNHTIPLTLIETGLPTNPVQVLDLSIVLPGIFTVSVLLLKKKSAGLFFVPAILTFFILMDVTIAFLSLAIHQNSETFVLASVMILLGLFSVVLLVRYFKSLQKQA
jgi:hypothetical protein